MLLPAGTMLESLAAATRLLGDGEGADRMGSAQQSVDAALRLLHTRETGGASGVRGHFAELLRTVDGLTGVLPARPALQAALQTVRNDCAAAAALDSVAALEMAYAQTLAAVEALAVAIAEDPTIDSALRRQCGQLFTQWETADLQAQLGGAQNSGGDDTGIDAGRMRAYLRDRFKDATLEVSAFRQLPGGFGKETSLFTVEGAALSGDFVLRRDSSEPVIDNDCHRIDIEYQLISAVHARGFPAPEALWVDTEHALLPGGDFLVMRRAPGVPRGDVFGMRGGIPAELSETLAGILARLHALPAMPELDTLSDSINLERTRMSRADCVRAYLETWLDTFRQQAHLPSPASLSQFHWLLAHVPAMPGSPVLLHGDIGFHNFLFDDNRLSAVLDWEFTHLGDPAEDLAYVRNTIGGSLDWPAFMAAYRDAGGEAIDETRLRFFQVWGHLRNACAGNLAAARFARGEVTDLKLVLLPHQHVPMFLNAAQAVIDQFEE